MTDLALTWDPEAAAADLAITANDLASDEGLETAVLLSLFTDRAAEPGDVLPERDTDRRGWWADALPVVDGDKLGSRLWLLARSKATPDVPSRVEEYAREALAWLTEDRVASKVDVIAEFLRDTAGSAIGWALGVDVYRPDRSDPVSFRYGAAWAAQEKRL